MQERRGGSTEEIKRRASEMASGDTGTQTASEKRVPDQESLRLSFQEVEVFPQALVFNYLY